MLVDPKKVKFIRTSSTKELAAEVNKTLSRWEAKGRKLAFFEVHMYPEAGPKPAKKKPRKPRKAKP